ncbi:P-loop containing nucleoside triphosphate hydrolase protein [Gigaspora margarita]|uniref:Structural maintenance of chromosomes protein 5 n=1 Tax=Gigaspora margarita TaxID=4874 RepID=A0A8H4AGK4_GIGMA|nr:P-loop containing nucleoside triphosphate hydrolase protein [Gigaspora margarita]
MSRRSRLKGKEILETESLSRQHSTGEDSLSEGENAIEKGVKRIKLDERISQEASSSGRSSNTEKHAKQKAYDEFQIGSIVRVCLKNFVTYDSVEFFPGPNLNMIIGPNGTGKSTIVCAIALGLGWNTSLLGRAKEISDFVKHGQERASIEIELKNKGRNVVITRMIRKSNNLSQWKLNGQPATHREVSSKVNSLNIQVDNLCQFLPQDKVCEFAQMSPSELLVQTQKAVGEKELIEWHETLIQLREEEKSLTTSIKTDSEQVENLEKRNSVLEKDVTRFREREAILKRVRLYELRIPFARYGVAKHLYDIAKQKRAEAHLEYQNLAKENEPASARKCELEDLVSRSAKEKKRCTELYSTKKRKMEEIATKLEQSEATSENIRKDLADLKRKERARKNRIAQLRNEITELEERTSSPPLASDDSDIRRKMDDVVRRLRESQPQLNDNKYNQDEINLAVRNVEREMQMIKQQLKELDDVKRRRLETIRRVDYDTFRAYEWLQQNKDKLSGRVFGPVCMEINIKDMQFADAIENALGNNNKIFVCETEQDYHTITRELCDNRRMRINVFFPKATMDSFTPPIPHQQLRSYGFVSYLLDLIEAPPRVQAALCDMSKLHAIPLARNESDINYDIIKGNRAFFKYYAGETSYSVSFSKYGQRFSQVLTNRIRPSKFFTATMNIEEKYELEKQLQECQIKLSRFDQQLSDLRKEYGNLQKSIELLYGERNAINEEKRKNQFALREFERLKVRLDSKRDQLQRELEQPASMMDEENALRKDFSKIAKKRGQLVTQIKKIMEECMQLFSGRILATLKHMQASSDLNALERQTQDRDEALKQAHIKFSEADAKFNSAKSEARRLLNEANAREGVDAETTRAVQELTLGMTLEELEDAVASERAKADLHYAINPSVIETYETRKAEIDSIKSRLSIKTSRLTKLTSDLATFREKWEPRLNSLVKEISQGFSNAFDRIGCVGEVRVSPHEDYDKWGIDILVKFRDNERLQALTGQRQSGGERSVSTIMYLMALQELSKTPFRVVDEINQGMDPRNERLVHSQMVQTACRPNTSQYFLITPKLLPDLQYHERMKILCIYNGEWQPETMNWKKYIADKKRSNN